MFRFRRNCRQIVLVMLTVLGCIQPALAAEADALTISANIRRLHMPYGTMLDPVFASSDPASPGYSEVRGYTRAGDSALWTGHYLAAEAFRYQVTRSADALANAWKAPEGIHSLLDVTGTDVLARRLIPVNSESAL